MIYHGGHEDTEPEKEMFQNPILNLCLSLRLRLFVPPW